MGIINLTEDSFSDGNEFLDIKIASAQVDKMILDGAKVIDVGAESTRPNADDISSQKQITRIMPLLEYIKQKFPQISVSIDTRSSIVAEYALKNGADIINDVSGLKFDRNMADTIAKFNAKVVIMHSRSTPKNMDNMCIYKNLIDEVYMELKEQCDYAKNKGVEAENIIIDVGFGFAKNFEQNIELLKRICEFKSLGYEILSGVSRKRFIQKLAQVENPKEADEMSSLIAAYLSSKGIDYIRAHNVKKTASAIKLGKIFNL